jgi:hypothetical protein
MHILAHNDDMALMESRRYGLDGVPPHASKSADMGTDKVAIPESEVIRFLDHELGISPFLPGSPSASGQPMWRNPNRLFGWVALPQTTSVPKMIGIVPRH